MRTPSLCCLTALLAASAAAPAAHAATLSVGPSGTFATPCAAFAAASAGDVIEIDAAGDYGGDVCQFAVDGLTIRGVGGRAVIDVTNGEIPNGKAIWVIQGNDTVVENIEFTGASVPDLNGAGIRQEGTNLTVRGCYFHHNENGILAGDDAESEILIEYSEFADNGYGDGQSHNFYINHVAKLTLRYSYSHRANIGHLVKSRALENHILYNRLTGEDGVMSYELDLPNAGRSYVIGNLIHQGSSADNNGSMLAYGEEGASNPSDELFVVNNTFVNDRSAGTFLNIGGEVTTPVVVRNNIFVGSGTTVTQSGAIEEGSCIGDALFVDQAGFDFELTAASPCVDAGVAPGTGAGLSLEPVHHYVHPVGEEGRVVVGTIDVGAYELGGGVAGAGGAGGAGSGGDAGGPSSGGAGTGGAGTGATSSGGSGTGASSIGAAAAAEEEDGCGCRLVGAGGRRLGPGLAAIASIALGALGRRAGRRARVRGRS